MAQRIGFEPANVDYFVEKLNPVWSLLNLRATVVNVREETHDTKSFELQPNMHWQGISAGQHVGVNVEINGVTHKRRYSLSRAEAVNADESKTIQITVKRVEGGLVSNHLHDHIQAGDVIGLEAADGDFVLPAELPNSLLVLTAGSGITPVFSQVATLLNEGYQGSIEFLHYVRSPADRIFGEQLEALAQQYSNLSVQWCFEAAEGQSKPERFSAKQLAKRVADYQERNAMLCGPAGFMEAVREHWADIGRSDALAFEYFGAPPVDATDAIDANITLKTGKQIQLNAGETLLDSLLENGPNLTADELPKYGCKRGVCHECKCRKTSGAVKNLLTGKVTAGEEDIQLCISAPVSDVTLG
jgi:ferredoxin-NADP reductase